MSRNQELSPTAQTARKSAVADILGASVSMLRKASTKTSLNDTDAVRTVAENMMDRCISAGLLPSIEMLAACCGVSRRYIYRFISEHPDHPTTDYLDALRTAFAACRISAVDRGSAAESLTIFLLKNSSLDYFDTHEVEISQPRSPIETDPERVEAIMNKYVQALPEAEERNEEA